MHEADLHGAYLAATALLSILPLAIGGVLVGLYLRASTHRPPRSEAEEGIRPGSAGVHHARQTSGAGTLAGVGPSILEKTGRYESP